MAGSFSGTGYFVGMDVAGNISKHIIINIAKFLTQYPNLLLLPDDLPACTNILPDNLHNKLSDFHHSACTDNITLEDLVNINIRGLLNRDIPPP